MASASISQVISKPNSTASPLSSSSSPCLSNRRIAKVSVSKSKNSKTSHISCSTKGNNETSGLDRRDVLVGLGSMSAAAVALTSSSGASKAATADTFPLPNFKTCQQAGLPDGTFPPTNCCPSYVIENYTNFELPPRSLPLRVRPAAQLADQAYYAKYNKALNKMKNLNCADPRSFTEQAKIHCAYCNGFYPTPGSSNPLQIHNGALFFPWHRWYLYFYERILCNMIDDDKFAIPFWNWDAKAGMIYPEAFIHEKVGNEKNYLFDENRDLTRCGKIMDLNVLANPSPPGTPDDQLIKSNLATMHRQLVNVSTRDFFGAPFVRGAADDAAGAGTIENTPHSDVHVWTGDPNKGGQDMGQFYSAGRDPLFYAHHANVDRSWSLWRQLGGEDFVDENWRNSEFLFFDEKAELKRVTVAQSLDHTKLRYSFQDVPLEWLNTPPTVTRLARSKRSATPPAITDLSSFPVLLSSVIHVKVPRTPGGEGREKLVISGIEVLDLKEHPAFGVYINAADHYEHLTPEDRGYLGGFNPLNTLHKGTAVSWRHDLSVVLEALGAEDDEEITVTIDPKRGTVKVGDIKVIRE